MSFWQSESTQINRIRVSTNLELLEQVLGWFDHLDQPSIPRSVWLQCQLALAEGFTNAVRHAHADQPADTPIDLEVTLKPQSIELRIWDYGSGFDLEKRLHMLPEPKNQDHAGGRGLKIIQQTADVFSYSTVDDERNCLLIVKHF